jgi:hypothetical protein
MTRTLGATAPRPRRLPCVAALALALATAAMTAPTAEAAPYLGGGEARQMLGRFLHRDFSYPPVTGSLAARCRRARVNVVRCYIAFQDVDGDYWCGPASVRETYTSYRYRWDLSLC